jgi:predicted amidohydrolase YtcJ
MPLEPDLLLVNAHVLTMDPARPRAAAVAVAGGRIAAVYDEAPGPADLPGVSPSRVIDLRGATLLPGFHDAHNHMTGFGLSLTELNLRTGSLDELYARVAARAAATPAGEWITGAGYDQTKLGGHPHRDALDAAAPGHRVWLKHTSGHMCVVNGLVLRDLGIGETAPAVDGGRVSADATGRPDGLLEERAQELVGSLTMPYPLSALTDAVAAAGERYLAEGLTSVTEAGVGGGWVGLSPVDFAAFTAAREQGRLHVDPVARHPRHGQQAHRLRGAVQRRRGGHRRAGAARLHLGFRLRQQGRARQGLHRGGQARRLHRAVRRPDRHQPGPHRGPGGRRHHHRRRAPLLPPGLTGLSGLTGLTGLKAKHGQPGAHRNAGITSVAKSSADSEISALVMSPKPNSSEK